jgi:hypothetical protein
MKMRCHGCGKECDCEPFSGLCVECLIAMAKRDKPQPEKPFDYKAAQSGAEKDDPR